MRTRLVLGVAASLVVPLAYLACVGDVSNQQDGGSDAGNGDVNSPVQDAANDGLAPDAAPPLGCPLGCLPPAPGGGWVGPSAVFDGPPNQKPSACPQVYLQKEVEAHQGMTAAPAVCSCGSSSVKGASCSADVITYTGANCTGNMWFQGTLTLPGGNCVQNGNSGPVKVTAPVLDAGACTYPSPTTSLPAPAFNKQNVACGLPQNATCANMPACVATPVPDAPFTRLCIHKDGDVLCPSADYAARFLAYKTVGDTRACGTCTGSTVGGSCGTTWGTAANNPVCISTPPNAYATGACSNTTIGIGAYVGGAIGPSGITCTGDGGAPLGSATSQDPVTFCCNK